MTRQHFRNLAQQQKFAKPQVKVRKRSALYKQWELGCRCVARSCVDFNSNFNFDKFMEACGVED